MESMVALIEHTHEDAGPAEAKLHWSSVTGNLIALKYYREVHILILGNFIAGCNFFLGNTYDCCREI